MAPGIGAGILLSVVVSLTASAHIRAVVCKCPKGLQRILAAVPVFVAFAAAPVLLFDRHMNVVAILLASAFLLWWGNFKLLALCWGKGLLVENLATHQHQTWLGYIGFTALLSLPIVIETPKLKIRADGVNHKANGANGHCQASLPNGTARSSLANGHPSESKCSNPISGRKEQQWIALLRSSLAHGAIFVCLIYLLDFRAYLPEICVELIYVLIMYCHMMFSFPLGAVFVSAMLGVELLGHFDKPWLSRSLADFWGHRWNLTANRVLREAVYFPMKEKLEGVLFCDRPPKPEKVEADANTILPPLTTVPQARRKKIAKGIAAMTTFFVSGFMHEVIIYYATGEATGEWTAFFTLHGTAFLIESEIIFPLAKHYRLEMPRWAKTVVTLSFFMVTAKWLFFPPVIRSGLDRAGLNEFRTLLRAILGF